MWNIHDYFCGTDLNTHASVIAGVIRISGCYNLHDLKFITLMIYLNE